MSVEFVDTNILVYAHDRSAGRKHTTSIELIERLNAEGGGAVSTQVLAELYSIATRKLGFSSGEAEGMVFDFGGWLIHRPTHASLLHAAALQRRYKINWWDALIVNSAIELGCSVLWTEDLTHGQRFSGVPARNPFA